MQTAVAVAQRLLLNVIAVIAKFWCIFKCIYLVVVIMSGLLHELVLRQQEVEMNHNKSGKKRSRSRSPTYSPHRSSRRRRNTTASRDKAFNIKQLGALGGINGVFNVPNQHDANTCYLHSGLVALQASIDIAHVDNMIPFRPSPSLQEGMSCCLVPGSTIEGGRAYRVYDQVKKYGICSRHVYADEKPRNFGEKSRYRGWCRRCEDPLTVGPSIKIADYCLKWKPVSVDLVKDALRRGHAVVVSLYVSKEFSIHMVNKEDVMVNHIYEEYSEAEQHHAHSMVITGFNESPSGIPYYEVMNTWGPNWGLKGYVNIAESFTKWFRYITYPRGPYLV